MAAFPSSMSVRFSGCVDDLRLAVAMREATLGIVKIMSGGSRTSPDYVFGASGHFAVMPAKA